MHRQTVRYARNGALGAIGLYLAITVPLLGLSLHGNSYAEHAPLPSASAPLQASR